jgi:hypothetical protein
MIERGIKLEQDFDGQNVRGLNVAVQKLYVTTIKIENLLERLGITGHLLISNPLCHESLHPAFD